MNTSTRRRVRAPARDDLLHLGSLITYLHQGTERCLGYLFHAEGHGSFDPAFGRVEVTQEEAAYHNLALSQAEIKGLDENCEIGQGAYFYIGNADSKGRVTVTTWIGSLVSDTAIRTGKNVRFQRGGKSFVGRASCVGPVFFKRTP